MFEIKKDYAMQHYSDNFASEGRMNITSMNFSKEVGSGASGILSGSNSSNSYHASSDTTLFSSSLPVLPHPKLILNNGDDVDVSSNVSKLLPGDEDDVDGNDLLDDVERHIIGNLLPGDEDELLAGIMDSYDLSGLGLPNESDDYDFFGSGGGLELELDPQENLSMGMSKMSLGEGVVGNGVAHFNIPNGVGTVAGEHPYGEHPSRTLFVRNINSNVEDSELKALFEQYGDIRTLFTQCKTRGFVMISYYDIRAARTAMRALQNKPLRRRKLDIHYSIPKDNPSDKDVNQGTLVVFNLDPSVSCEDLLQIFGAYGEVKEIRETPHKRHHKFIEYYDVRSAEAALRSLNRSDIAGKRIKLEPSRPGGARRNLLLQLNQDFEQDDSRTFRLQVGSSMANSPPGVWPQFGSPIEHSPLQSLSKSPVFSSMSPTPGNSLPGLASILHPQPARIAPIGKDHGKGSHLEHIFPNGNSNHGGGAAFQHSHSLPEPKLGQYSGAQVETLSGPQFLWGSPSLYNDQNNPSASWRSPSIGHHPFPSKGPSHGFPSNGRPGSLLNHHQHHHVGSAPSGIPFEGRFGHFHGSPETFFMSPPSSFGGGMGLGHVDRGFMGARGAMNSNMSVPGNGNITENGSSGFSTMSSQRLNPIFLGNGHFPVLGSANIDSLTERARNRRVEQNGSQMDSKKQFQLDLEKILSGKDNRTTLMIKNIPNKYTSKMLLAAIDENHKGTYDFLYLPIDFKNKCNVGYAFINMLSPAHIVPFYQAFNGKKWEKFNSEKVASLAYARIQGKAALVTHFQNSSLMNEDKRCRPILFHSDGLEGGDQIIQDPLQSSSLNIQNHNRSNGSESEYSSGSPGNDVAGERGMFPDHS